MDRASLDFARLHTVPAMRPQYRPLCAPGKKEHEAKTSLFASRQALGDRTTGILCNPTVGPDGPEEVTPSKDDPDTRRRIQDHDRATEKTRVFLTHDYVRPSHTLADV